jgi:hypothetical protein
MPELDPANWDDQDLTWDMPGLTWNGPKPLNNNASKVMTQNIVTLDITDADWIAIDAALTTIETKLGAKLVDLTPEQRSDLSKMGPKSETFCRQTLVVGRQNVASLPAQTVTDLTEEEGDLGGIDKLRPRLARITSLKEKGDDTSLALGSDIMVFALSLYGLLKAIGQGAGLDELRAQMKARFTRKAKSSTPPPA